MKWSIWVVVSSECEYTVQVQVNTKTTVIMKIEEEENWQTSMEEKEMGTVSKLRRNETSYHKITNFV